MVRSGREHGTDAEDQREWIITNGLGGYASGTVCGVPTRRYHGLLIAALPTPFSRTMMLNQLHEQVVVANGEPMASAWRFWRRSEARIEKAGSWSSASSWVCRSGVSRPAGITLEKRLLIPHLQNTVHVSYRLVESDNVLDGRAASAAARAFSLT